MRGRNSLSGSHQRCANSKFASSAGSAFTDHAHALIVPLVLLGPRKDPVAGAFSGRPREISWHGCQRLQAAAVLGAAFPCTCCRQRAASRPAFGVDAVALDALGHQIRLHGFGDAPTASGCRHRCRRSRWPTAMITSRLMPWILLTRSSSLALTFGLQDGLVEIEEGIGRVGDLWAATGAGAGGSRAAAARAQARQRPAPGRLVASPGHHRNLQRRWRASSRHHASTARWCRSSRPACQCRSASCRRRCRVGEALNRHRGCNRRGQQHRHFVQFLHGSPHWGKSRSRLRKSGRFSDHHRKR